MKQFLLKLKKILIIFYLLAIHFFAALFAYEKFIRHYFVSDSLRIENITDPTAKTEIPTPVAAPSIIPDETPQIDSNTNQSTDSPTPASQTPEIAPNSSGKLMIPVAGIKREQIRDTFNDARSEGRVHNANDIMAAGGTPVLAASDGEIAKFFDSVRGGITIYQYSPDKKMVYYYAHLQKRADNLKEHDFVKQGTVIGYVGDTGNAGAGNYHLHFAITILDDPKNIFKGTDINPYSLLKEGIESR
jgi:murein DD-endopeptidase MepM/ murein hydrolase activator NlpD